MGGGGVVVRRMPVSSNVSRSAQSFRVSRSGVVGVGVSWGETMPPGKTWKLGKLLEWAGRWTRRSSFRGFRRIRLLWVISFVCFGFGGHGKEVPRAQSGNGRGFRCPCRGHSKDMVWKSKADGGGSREKYWCFCKEKVATH